MSVHKLDYKKAVLNKKDVRFKMNSLVHELSIRTEKIEAIIIRFEDGTIEGI